MPEAFSAGLEESFFFSLPLSLPGKFQLLSLYQCLGENPLKLPQGQEGLGLLWAPQTLGRLAQGERS